MKNIEIVNSFLGLIIQIHLETFQRCKLKRFADIKDVQEYKSLSLGGSSTEGIGQISRKRNTTGESLFRAPFQLSFSQLIQSLKPGAEFGRPGPMEQPWPRPGPQISLGWKA
ncbi:MAG: hypothetical protein PHQ34_12915, partial [Methanothrix sp.]|nr:hypothetical protein [Methanothrix sp.]